MKQLHRYHSDSKLAWFGYGEWVEEPDEITFEHDSFTCKVIRIVKFENSHDAFGGHLCGYVKIPKDHPWHGKGYDDIETNVHGGLTFCGDHLFDGSDDYWVGFDCAHSDDICPSIVKHTGELYEKDPEYKRLTDKLPRIMGLLPTYKNIAYAISECKSLAERAKLEEKKSDN